MKKILLIALTICSLSSFSQDKIIKANLQYNRNIVVMTSNHSELKGSPYLCDDWKEGYLTKNDNMAYYHEKLIFNQETGQLYLNVTDNEKEAMILNDTNVTGFSLHLNPLEKRYFVKLNSSDFALGSDVHDARFFEVLSNETNFLIKNEEKYIYDKNISRGHSSNLSTDRVYKTNTKHYIKTSDGKYHYTKLTKSGVTKLLKDKSSEIKQYLKKNKINFKEEKQVIQLLNYYHSL